MFIKQITFRPCSGRGTKGRGRNKARVYIHTSGESLAENLMGRRTRPYNVYKKELLPKLAQLLGLNLDELDLRWSQKAGCTCSCSPGFVDGSYRLTRDIHVTITADSSWVVPVFEGNVPRGNEKLAY